MRCGTNNQIEVGRWEKVLLPEERLCAICVSGAVEDELHVLLDCPAYAKFRMRLFRRIRACTGDLYNLSAMREDRDWITDFLLGQGVRNVKHRCIIQQEVGCYLFCALRQRESWLADSQ